MLAGEWPAVLASGKIGICSQDEIRPGLTHHWEDHADDKLVSHGT